MNVLFVYPTWKLERTVNHGIANLAAYIKSKGHIAKLAYLESDTYDSIFKLIEDYKPGLIGINVVTNQWEIVKDFIRKSKTRYRIPIVVGGPHINADPQSIRDIPEVDGACQGEGEIPLLEYITRLEENKPVNDIGNFYFNSNGTVMGNAFHDLINNLDDLPFPDYSIFPREVYLNYPSLSFSRGCPHVCTYCCNENLRDLYRDKGSYIRFKSIPKVLDEIQSVIANYKPSILNFDDDSFTKSRKWVLEFCAAYKKNVSTPFRCNARPEQLDEEMIRALKNAGCDLISIGIESGSEKIRREVLKRTMSNESITKAFSLCKKYGIKTSAFNMVGIPEETPDTFKETIELNKKVASDMVQLTIFYPYPGTPLGIYAKQKGYIMEGGHAQSYFRNGVLNLPGFSHEQIRKAYKQFYWEVYSAQHLLKGLYFYILKVYLEEHPFLWEKAKLLKRTLKKILMR